MIWFKMKNIEGLTIKSFYPLSDSIIVIEFTNGKSIYISSNDESILDVGIAEKTNEKINIVHGIGVL